MRSLAAGMPFALLALSGAHAQSPRPAGVRSRVDVHAVEIEATATAKDGSPVTDLTPDEFLLRMDGIPAALDYAVAVSKGRRPATDPGAETAAVPRAVFLILDDEHLQPEDRASAFGAARAVVDDLSATEHVAIATTRLGRLHPVVPFGRSTEDARAAIDRLERPPSLGMAFLERLPAPIRWGRERNTLELLERAVRGLGSRPGRREVVLVSRGVNRYPADARSSLMPEFRRLAEQANRSGVTVHTIGAEGLVNPAFRDAAAPRLAAVALSKPSCNLVRDDCDALEDLSTETGGFHVHRSNDLAVAARAIRRSSAAYYAIGATLATAPKDGSGYRVELASRRPGVTVRVRRRAVARDAADEAREAAEAASLFGGGPTDIAVELTLRPAARTAGARSRRDVPFALRVPVDALTFEPGPTGRSADLELTFIAADARGDVSPPAVVNVPVRIPDSDWESRRGATWPYESVFRARKETRRFTVIVRDVRSNRLGAAEVATSLD